MKVFQLSIVECYLHKALERLRASGKFLDGSYCEDAIFRACYATYYAVKATLESPNIFPKRIGDSSQSFGGSLF